MSTIPPLTSVEIKRFNRLQGEFNKKVCLTGCSVTAASFLLVTALIIIFCSALCLTLPGVNAMRDVVFRAMLPACLLILLSLPLILHSVALAQEKQRARRLLISEITRSLERHEIPEIDSKKDRKAFIFNNFFNKTWSGVYQEKLIKDLSDYMQLGEKVLNPRQKRIKVTLDKIQQEIYSKKKKPKKKT